MKELCPTQPPEKTFIWPNLSKKEGGKTIVHKPDGQTAFASPPEGTAGVYYAESGITCWGWNPKDEQWEKLINFGNSFSTQHPWVLFTPPANPLDHDPASVFIHFAWWQDQGGENGNNNEDEDSVIGDLSPIGLGDDRPVTVAARNNERERNPNADGFAFFPVEGNTPQELPASLAATAEAAQYIAWLVSLLKLSLKVQRIQNESVCPNNCPKVNISLSNLKSELRRNGSFTIKLFGAAYTVWHALYNSAVDVKITCE